MTLTEISYRLQDMAINIEKFDHDRISEELFVLADYIDDLENDVTGTLLGLSEGLKNLQKKESKLLISDIVKNNRIEIVVS